MTEDRFRILITGSRNWLDPTKIQAELEAVMVKYGPLPYTVVHGGAVGADLMAAHAAEVLGEKYDIEIEEHPADWSLGRAAGPIRNQYMVDLGAHVCLAFIRNNSAGASHCRDACYEAGIPVRQFTY